MTVAVPDDVRRVRAAARARRLGDDQRAARYRRRGRRRRSSGTVPRVCRVSRGTRGAESPSASRARSTWGVSAWTSPRCARRFLRSASRWRRNPGGSSPRRPGKSATGSTGGSRNCWRSWNSRGTRRRRSRRCATSARPCLGSVSIRCSCSTSVCRFTTRSFNSGGTCRTRTTPFARRRSFGRRV